MSLERSIPLVEVPWAHFLSLAFLVQVLERFVLLAQVPRARFLLLAFLVRIFLLRLGSIPDARQCFFVWLSGRLLLDLFVG